jgi:hypothetical protein
MAVIGVDIEPDVLVLTKHRDFKWVFENVDKDNNPIPFPAGKLFFELGTAPVVKWEFVIAGSRATLKVESEQVDKVQARTCWQLVWLPDGEAAGGDPVAFGKVKVQAECS